MDYVINNATLWANTPDAELTPHSSIHIQDGLITYVGPEKEPDFAPDRVIDAKEDLVMPSFFNGHTHLAQTILRGYAEDLDMDDWLDRIHPAEEQFTDDMVYWSSLLAMCEMVRGGTTGFNEMHTNLRPIAQAVEDSGMRAILARGVSTRGNTAQETTYKLKDAEEIFLEWNGAGNGRIRIFFGPRSYYNNMDSVVSALGDLAKLYNTGIHTHLSETLEGHRLCVRETGMTPAAYYSSMGLMEIPFVAAQGVYMTENDARIFAAQGACLVVCVRSNLKLHNGVPPLGRFQRHNVPVAIGTDSAAANNRLSVLSEIDTLSLVQKADLQDSADYKPRDLLRMACVTGRATAGIKSGELKPGWNADLIIINTHGVRWRPNWDDLSTLVASAQDMRVRMTMCAGEVLFEDNEIKFCDENEVLAKATELKNKIR